MIKGIAEVFAYFLNRSLIKSIYMPLVYGKSMFAAVQDILKSKLASIASIKECYQLGKLIYTVWNKKYPEINNLMKLVNTVGWFAAFLDKPVRYRNILITSVQDYMEQEEIHVWVYDRKKKKRHKISLAMPSTNRDKRKTLRATFANYIHQLDSTIASLVIGKCSVK